MTGPRCRVVAWLTLSFAARSAYAEAPPTAENVLDTLLAAPTIAAPPVARSEPTTEELVSRWAGWRGRGRPPDDATRARLLDFVREHADALPELAAVLPATPEADALIKRILDQRPRPAGWRAPVVEVLRRRGRYYRAELIAAARAARDDEDWGTKGVEDLEALAKLDWRTAAPILNAHASGNERRIAVIALGMLFRHAALAGDPALNDLRARLDAIVSDTGERPDLRNSAFEALSSVPWDGQEAWYLERFASNTLAELTEDHMIYHPSCTTLWMDPDRWIPIVRRFVGDPNRALHDQAVGCLVQFHLENARRDALEPLLPWLADEKWSSARDRLRLIQSLQAMTFPGVVEGLIAAVERSSEASERAYAADALVAHPDPRAARAIRGALDRAESISDQTRLCLAYIEAGVSDEEAVAAIEAYAAVKEDASTRERLRGFGPATLAWRVTLGAQLARSQPSEAVTARVVAAASRARSATVAQALRQIAAGWSGGDADRALVKNLTSDARVTYQALARRDALKASVSKELGRIARGNGAAAGVAAVVLDDRALLAEILAKRDRDAQAFALAAARLVRMELPLDLVIAATRSGDARVASAAEGHLRAADTPETREALYARHPGGALILGRRQAGDPGHHSNHRFDRIEDAMRERILGPNGPDEIIALLSAGYWGGPPDIVVEIRGKQARLVLGNDPVVETFSELEPDALSGLRELIVTKRIDELGPLETSTHDGVQHEYVHVTKDRGRRVYMNNPNAGAAPYWALCERFRDLLRNRKMETRYLVPVEVVIAAPRVSQLAHDAQGLLVRIGEKGKTTWRRWDAHRGALGPTVAAPTPRRDPPRPPTPPFFRMSVHDWAAIVDGTSYAIGGRGERYGLWRWKDGEDPSLLLEGNVLQPVFTPDGRWCVIEKTDTDWSAPNYLVRIDLKTGASSRLDVPAADALATILWLDTHEKFLIRGAKDDDPTGGRVAVGPDRPEYRLLDVAAGTTEIVEGEFAPIDAADSQPTSTVGVVWAVRATSQSGLGFELGRYDRRTFQFDRVLSAPDLFVPDAGGWWVDEAQGRLLFVYGSAVLGRSFR